MTSATILQLLNVKWHRIQFLLRRNTKTTTGSRTAAFLHDTTLPTHPHVCLN